jgi:hypothetical protein
VTLVTLAATAFSSVAMAWALRGDAGFSLRTGPPLELGALTHVQLGANMENRWVHASGPLADQAAEYRRPLDADRFRLVRAQGNPHLWVELRVPAGLEPERYVAPNSFVGRLVPFEHAGLRYAAVTEAAAILGNAPDGSHSSLENAWLLVDGEAPATTRWAIGLIGLFLAFATFSVWGIARLQRAVRPSASLPADTP